MTDHAQNKQIVAAFLTKIADRPPNESRAIIARYCHEDVRWEVFHPFYTFEGTEAGLAGFFGNRCAMPFPITNSGSR